jgi:hypothetical protein
MLFIGLLAMFLIFFYDSSYGKVIKNNIPAKRGSIMEII